MQKKGDEGMIIMQCGRGRQARDWHVHEQRPPQYLRIYHMDGGTVTYRDSQESFALRSGFLYVLPAQKGYELVQDPDDPISCMYLHADVFPYVVSRAIKIDSALDPDISATLRLMQSQLAHPAGDSCCAAFGMALLQLLIRDGHLKQKIDPALVDLESLSTASSVKTMSREAGYSCEHFIRTFAGAAGVTPYQYLLSQRMNEAVALMNQGLTLEEIAARVGYASAKSFSGAFKRRFGLSPQAYREQFLRRA